MPRRRKNKPPPSSARHELVRRALVLDPQNLGDRVVSGAGFTFLGIALRTLITLGSVSVLARLLTPADFGYIAMATVVTELAAMLGGFGFVNVLIQRRVANRLQFDTVFWATSGVGALLAVAVFGFSFLAEWFFGEPLAGELLRVLCVNFVLGGLTSVHQAILARMLRFRTEFWIQIATIFTRSVAAILFAFAGFGVWSLVAGPIVASILSVVLYWWAIPYWPRFRFHGHYLASSWKTSGSYFVSGLLYYANMNADLLLIGRALGADVLGYYQNARSLTDEVRGRLAMPLQRVLFPAFSSIQADRSHLQYSVLRSGKVLAAIVIPVGIGLSAVAEELVPVLYGVQWLPMAPILTLLGVSAAIKGATAIASPLFNSQNRVGLALRYNLIGTALLLTGILVAMPYGIEPVATALAVISLYSVVVFRAGLKLIGLGDRAVIDVLGAPALAASVMWLTISAVRSIEAIENWPAVGLLFVHIALGAITYALVLHAISRYYLKEFLALGRRIFCA